MKLFRSVGLSQRFVLLIGAVVLVTAFMSRAFYTRQERTDLELRLREKAVFLNNFYSVLIADSLLRKDDITLLQVINRLEEDKEITAVVVVDQGSQIRYHINPQKIGSRTEDPSLKDVLRTGEGTMNPFKNEGGRALAVLLPLKMQGASKPMGAVRIDLTYLQIERQLEASATRFWFIIIGSVVSWTGIAMLFIRRWVLIPMKNLSAWTTTVNPAAPEPNLPKESGDLGLLYGSINDLLVRFKNEWQHQWSRQTRKEEQEKAWIQQLVRSFLPDSRIIVADRDNRIIADTANGVSGSHTSRHLMDLIKEPDFANLLNAAFQKEGDFVKGTITLQNQSYQASILNVPIQQSIIVKTLIALKPS